jgi:hypothetical protein
MKIMKDGKKWSWTIQWMNEILKVLYYLL